MAKMATSLPPQRCAGRRPLSCHGRPVVGRPTRAPTRTPQRTKVDTPHTPTQAAPPPPRGPAMTRITLAAFAALLLAAPARPAEPDPLDNWPHWRGPLANGSAPRGKPPLKWDAKTNVKW